MSTVVHPSVEERKAHGKSARKELGPSAHAGWTPAPDRPDPVALLEEQDTTREQDLVHQRRQGDEEDAPIDPAARTGLSGHRPPLYTKARRR